MPLPVGAQEENALEADNNEVINTEEATETPLVNGTVDNKEGGTLEKVCTFVVFSFNNSHINI